jgi:polyisoprenyl-phosphate glycosyltransferase
MKLISIITPIFNEEENIEVIYMRVKNLFKSIKKYHYEHIFIDNCSDDNSLHLLKEIAQKDKNVKIIVNSRNFGWIRSQYHAMLEANGDSIILLVADLQDPPELIKEFIEYWEKGYLSVVGVEKGSEENGFTLYFRKLFYKFVSSISEVELLENFTGFGLYDRKVINILRNLGDPYPYFRGLVAEIGHPMKKVEYFQKNRMKGDTKSDLFKLLDLALLGIMSYSRLPLRIITILGIVLSVISLIISFIYLVLKILLWNSYPMGTITLVIGLFFFASVQMMFIGIIGEYIGLIHIRSIKRPLVIEKERVNL